MKIDIQILKTIKEAHKSKGLTVVIDVFRAFSTECYIMSNNANMIIPVDDINLAYKLKKENPDFILMGEREGKKQKDFDYGNSPTEIEYVDFIGKTVIHTTSSGTQGIMLSENADEIITGSFVNLRAVVNYIKSRNPENLTLLCTAPTSLEDENEDTLCADYIVSSLYNKELNFDRIINYLRAYSPEFLDTEKYWKPLRDFELCLILDKFDFVLKAESYRDNLMCIKAIRK